MAELFSQEIKEFVFNNYIGCGPSEMAKVVNEKFGKNYTKQQLKSYYANHHLNSGLTGYYEKGHVPANKGKKGYYAPGCEKGWFKEGHIPKNHKPVGSERITKDGYVEIKIAEPNKWVLKHRYVWEQNNGPVPKGFIVRFLDQNKQNCSIENLALVSRAEHIEITRRNLSFDAAELSKTGIGIAKVNVAFRKLKEKAKEQ